MAASYLALMASTMSPNDRVLIAPMQMAPRLWQPPYAASSLRTW